MVIRVNVSLFLFLNGGSLGNRWVEKMGIFLIILGVFIAFFGGIAGFIIGMLMCGFGGFILFNPSIYTDAGVETGDSYYDEEDE